MNKFDSHVLKLIFKAEHEDLILGWFQTTPVRWGNFKYETRPCAEPGYKELVLTGDVENFRGIFIGFSDCYNMFVIKG